MKLLEGFQEESNGDSSSFTQHLPKIGRYQNSGNCPDVSLPFTGIGMDCSITPTRHHNLSLVQTTDFFYPLVDDPYIMGKITCANVLSDLYAVGVTDCDNMLMLLGVPQKMSEKEREIIIPIIIRGFKDTALEAGVQVTGGQTVFNPWLTIGGVASSICQNAEFIL